MTQTSPSPQITTIHPRPHRGFIATLWHDFIGMFTERQRYKIDETICYSVHRSFYLWPLILFGWITSMVVPHFFPKHAVGWTWAYIWILAYTFVMLLFDLSLMKLIISTGAFLLFFITAKYIEAVRNVVLLGHIINHFRNLRPEMHGGFGSVVSWILFVPWFIMIGEALRSGRKSFSPNGIEERSLGVGVEITDRSGLHFSCRYPDLLETLLGFGSGTIVAYDSTNKVVREWPNVFGLYFKWKRLDEILHQRSAVVDNTQAEPVETVIVKPQAQNQE